ncbi:MAG TPA: cyclic nucleotide-binding domain-containing protein [Puia sp.]|nr:cyclic nucleotide-binding domain-containing protein [Puia sp.]
MKPLFDLIAGYSKLSDLSKELLPTLLFEKDVKKNETILKEGQVCRHIYFIESGLVRIYYNLHEKEVTSWLLKENNIFIEVESFFGQIPSRQSIVAVEDTKLWGITYDQLQWLCMEDVSFLWNRIYITQAYYRISDQKQKDMVMKSSLEKYIALMKTAPDLLERVPLKYLYSYLGVSKASFDRARSKYAKGEADDESIK